MNALFLLGVAALAAATVWASPWVFVLVSLALLGGAVGLVAVALRKRGYTGGDQ